MRIKVALLDDDKNYLNRLSSVFSNNFSDKLEIYSFSNAEVAVSELEKNKINVFLASETFDINTELLPVGCGFAYFVSSTGVETLRNQKTICRFQKAELIFKEILGIYSENVSDAISIKFEGDGTSSLITFVSASGGVGTSTAAVACAKKIARCGKKVLYINLEMFGSADNFFSGAGQFDLSNVIFSLKSKKSASVLKMESYVKEDASGVYFYSSPKMALDVIDLSVEDIETLFSSIKMMNSYEFIVVDIDFSFSPTVIKLLEMSQCIVCVSDGSEVSNDKFIRAYQALEVFEQQKEINILSKLTLLYNKFSSRTGKVIDNRTIKSLGGMRVVSNADEAQIIDEMIREDIFDKIINKTI